MVDCGFVAGLGWPGLCVADWLCSFTDCLGLWLGII